MAGIKLQKRDFDFFVSYGHRDTPRVAPLVDLLKRVCGLHVWFYGAAGNAAQRSSELLGAAIGNARGAVFCLSESWKDSSWCRDEYDVSLSEQRMRDGFVIVCVRLDDVEQPDWFNVADIVDLKYLGEQRIQAIQRTTRGVVALLPHDPAQPGVATSPYILQEARWAIEQHRPLLLLAEPGANPPEDLVRQAFHGTAFALAPEGDRAALEAVFDDFDESLQRRLHNDAGAYIFWAGSLRGDPREADDIATVIERASNMRCVRGERLAGDNVQTSIVERIRNAAAVLADVTDDNRNTLIEAGIAMGCGTRLKLMCREPPPGTPLKKRFMFEGQEFFWYRTAEERLGLAFYFARQFRRCVYVFH